MLGCSEDEVNHSVDDSYRGPGPRFYPANVAWLCRGWAYRGSVRRVHSRLYWVGFPQRM